MVIKCTKCEEIITICSVCGRGFEINEDIYCVIHADGLREHFDDTLCLFDCLEIKQAEAVEM